MKAFNFVTSIKGEEFVVEYRTDKSAIRFTSSKREKQGFLPLRADQFISSEEDMKMFIEPILFTEDLNKLVWV